MSGQAGGGGAGESHTRERRAREAILTISGLDDAGPARQIASALIVCELDGSPDGAFEILVQQRPWHVFTKIGRPKKFTIRRNILRESAGAPHLSREAPIGVVEQLLQARR